MKNCILGMDIGGTNIRMGLVDKQGKAAFVEVVPSRSVYQMENTLDGLCSVIDQYCKKHLGENRPLLVAAGFPSVVDKERRRLYSSTNFPGLDGVDIVEEMEKRLQLPVIIDHDACFLLAYDVSRSEIKEEGAVIGLYYGTGMGNAIRIGGKSFTGKNGTTAEVGHMPVEAEGRLCSCGNKGCLEMYCCGKALEKIREESFPKTPWEDLFEKYRDSKELDGFVRYMAFPAAAEINILDPDAVFIGGGIPAMKGFPKERLVKYILENTRKPYPAENINIIFSEASAENGIVGAAIEGFKKLDQVIA